MAITARLVIRSGVNDRIVGLNSGADDYLSKPFEPRELVVRIENILSRIENDKTTIKPNILKLSNLEINKSSHEVLVAGEPVELTAKEFTLLLLLVEIPGKVFSRDYIMNELSGIDSKVFSRSVDILVSRLRHKLKPLNCIETVWGVGYKFNED